MDKLTKDTLIRVIQTYYGKQGRKLSNVGKATKNELIKYIEKKGVPIDIDEERIKQKERQTEEKERMEKNRQEQKEQDEIWEAERKEKLALDEQRAEVWLNADVNSKMKFIDEYMEKVEEEFNANLPENIEKNKKLEKEVDEMFNKYKDGKSNPYTGARFFGNEVISLEREDIGSIRVNGIIVNFGYECDVEFDYEKAFFACEENIIKGYFATI
jgi:hypothetical protein